MPRHGQKPPSLFDKEGVAGYLLGLALSAGYVFTLYLIPQQHSRDHAQTIQRRMACTVAYCCMAWLPAYLFLNCKDMGDFRQLVGVCWEGVWSATLYPLLTTSLLFLGPLAQKCTAKEGWWRYPEPLLSCPAALRDLIIAPLTEEFVFRCLIIAILLHSAVSPGVAVLIAPLFFGVAHIHHYCEYVRHKGMAPSHALRLVAFQFAYTTVFGWLAAWNYERYRHLLAAVLPHAFCNFMGMPDWSAISSHKFPHVIMTLYLTGIVAFVSAILWQAS